MKFFLLSLLMLQKCGIVLSWKRVQGASGKLQGIYITFGVIRLGEIADRKQRYWIKFVHITASSCTGACTVLT